MIPRSPLHALFLGASGLLAVVAVIALAIGVGQYVGFQLDAARHAKVLDRPSPWLPEVHERESSELGGYRWIDRKRGVIGLPIERALELTLAERGRP